MIKSESSDLVAQRKLLLSKMLDYERLEEQEDELRTQQDKIEEHTHKLKEQLHVYEKVLADLNAEVTSLEGQKEILDKEIRGRKAHCKTLKEKIFQLKLIHDQIL
mmetsp:Transcript_3660/g.10009  ORF Transcript_3660/g.10009 Transcript_3660/m.10009 type:complete len:105 (+) Transcript_3660:647-961(+)